MKTIKRSDGSDVKIFAKTIEDKAFSQIRELADTAHIADIIKPIYNFKARGISIKELCDRTEIPTSVFYKWSGKLPLALQYFERADRALAEIEKTKGI